MGADTELTQMHQTCTAGDLRDDYSVGFDLEANRAQLGPSPPRVVHPVPLDEVWRHMQDMLTHLLLVCELPKAGRLPR